MKADKSNAGLHSSIKNGVLEEHDRAENSDFSKLLLKGRVSKALYQIFLADLYFIYTALEEEAARLVNHPVFAAMYFPEELNRKNALEKDLEFYYGSKWKSEINCTQAATSYVNRIREVAESNPSLLISHCYTRYMGDLSGGQMFRYKLAKCFSLPPENQGVQFYVFDKITSVTGFKDFYYGRLNSLDVTEQESEQIVMEAKRAFEYNIALFKEMDTVSRLMIGGYTVNGNQQDGEEKIAPRTDVLFLFFKIWGLASIVLLFAIAVSIFM